MTAANRMVRDIEALRAISEPCEEGVTRVAFTPEYRRGVDYIRGEMEKAGLAVREDDIGNVYGRREGSVAGLPALVSGSHLDTVRCAGAYDGIAGVAAALEVARRLQENGVQLRHPFEVLGFIEEEGTRFGQVMMGSRFVTGRLGEREAQAITAPDGARLAQVREAYAAPGAVPARRWPGEIAAFVELHDEQGPVLEAAGIEIGVVEGIVGIRQLTVTFLGEAGHAGTVPMTHRKDPAPAAFETAAALQAFVRGQYPDTAVATVGSFRLLPGSANGIPREASFTVDIRSADFGLVEAITERLRQEAASAAAAFHVEGRVAVQSAAMPVRLDAALQAEIEKACQTCGRSFRRISSGAGHDAMQMAAVWPAAMIFVPCRGGVTHNPAEYVAPQALEAGVEVLYETLLALDAR